MYHKSTVFILGFLIWAFSSIAATESYHDGPVLSTALTNKYVDIIKETIRIMPGIEFHKAFVSIQYEINTDTEGIQVPLLFACNHFEEYSGINWDSLHVWVDGHVMKVHGIYVDSADVKGTYFEDFGSSFQSPLCMPSVWAQNGKFESHLDVRACSYVKANLSKGHHVLRIDYDIWNGWRHRPWVDYWFTYSLEPAKCRRLESALEVIVDNRAHHYPLSVNWGKPNSGSMDSVATWNFDKYPAQDYLRIEYIDQENDRKRNEYIKNGAWIKEPSHILFMGIRTYAVVPYLLSALLLVMILFLVRYKFGSRNNK
jgi:hypothetical protein